MYHFECVKHSNNNREALTLHKYVNKGTSSQVTSPITIFDKHIAHGNQFRKQCLLSMYNYSYCSLGSLIYPIR